MPAERELPSSYTQGIVTNPSPPIYEKLNFVASSGNVSIVGNGTDNVSIFKTSGVVNSWDESAYATQAFTAPVTIEFNKYSAYTDNGRSYAMIGWNEDPATNSSYNSIDYASYPWRTNYYEVYNNGTLVYGASNFWGTKTKFYVVYDTDGYIRHYSGYLLITSFNYGVGKTVYVDTALYTPQPPFNGFTNIRVTRASWNGTSYSEQYIPRSGLQLYLDASLDTSANSVATTWFDLSGNARNFNIVSTAVRTGSNGFRYMDFNGSYGVAKSASDYSALANGAFTIIAFSKIGTTTTNWRTLTRSYVNDHHVIIDTSNNLGMYDNDVSGFLSSGYNVTTDSLTSTWNMLVWRMNTSSPYYDFSINGSTVSKGSITNVNASYTRGFGSIGGYHEGSTTPSSASQYWGFINAFIVYNRHITASEQLSLYNYFNSRPHAGN